MSLPRASIASELEQETGYKYIGNGQPILLVEIPRSMSIHTQQSVNFLPGEFLLIHKTDLLEKVLDRFFFCLVKTINSHLYFSYRNVFSKDISKNQLQILYEISFSFRAYK